MGIYGVPGRGGRAKNLGCVQGAIALTQQAHSGTLDWSLESISEALLTGFASRKDKGLEDG
jgi:hypothetical protein